MLLAGEQRPTGPAVARIVREDEETVCRWLKCWPAEGIAGIQDRPIAGGPAKITDAYRERHGPATAPNSGKKGLFVLVPCQP